MQPMKSNELNEPKIETIIAAACCVARPLPAQGTDEAHEALPPYTGPGENYDQASFGGAD